MPAGKRRRPNVLQAGDAEVAEAWKDGAGGAGAGAGAGHAATAVGPIVVPSLGRPHRVVVVGAGFAGIGAALELQRLGIEVVVLEVRGD